MHKFPKWLVAVALTVTFVPSSPLTAQEPGSKGPGISGLERGLRLSLPGNIDRSLRSALPIMSTGNRARLLRMEKVQQELKLEGDTLEKVKTVVKEDNIKRFEASEQAVQMIKAAMTEEAISKENTAKLQKEIEEKTMKLDAETDKILADLLDEGQWKRLGQLQFQLALRKRMKNFLLDDESAEQLAITKEQTTKLEAIKVEADKSEEEAKAKRSEMLQAARQELLQKPRQNRGDRAASREALMAVFKQRRKESSERSKKVDESVMAVLSDEQRKTLDDMTGEKFVFPKAKSGSGVGGGGFRSRPNRG